MSNFLSRLFRKKVEQTPLEKFIATITPEQFQRSYRSVKDPTLRVPAALSTRVLYLAHRFSSGLREMQTSIEKTFETSSAFPYDCVAFEASAFCHYWVMREFLNADEDDEPEENLRGRSDLRNRNYSSGQISDLCPGEAKLFESSRRIRPRPLTTSFFATRPCISRAITSRVVPRWSASCC